MSSRNNFQAPLLSLPDLSEPETCHWLTVTMATCSQRPVLSSVITQLRFLQPPTGQISVKV
ncbi:hypothetical protein PAMP_015594 [Pampus punctatissimus]